MIAGSYCVIAKKYPEYAVGALLSVVVVQGGHLSRSCSRNGQFHELELTCSGTLPLHSLHIGLGYGLIFDMSFFLRNLSVIGGLLMVLSDSLQTKKKLFAGLPSISETDRRK